MRVFLAGIAGYLVFGLSAVALFQGTGVDPHDPPHGWFLAASIPYGLLFAFGAGWLATRWAQRSFRGATVVAVLMALSGVISIVARPGAGAIWSQLATIFLFAPAALGGGWFGRAPNQHKAGGGN